MGNIRGAQRHFARVASVYDRYRNTDPDVIDAILDHLPMDRPEIHVADIGCGTGRYSALLTTSMNGALRLWCCDYSFEMLRECREELSDAMRDRLLRVCRVNAGKLPFTDQSLDAIVTFNAVHHFDLERFFAESARSLKPGSLLAVYTRTPEQNARTIWGQHFPGFNEKEQRLYPRERLERAVYNIPSLQLEDVRELSHHRIEPSDQLLDRARNFHYSTFALYSPEEFAAAFETFSQKLKFLGNGTVEHDSDNTLMLIRRTEATDLPYDVAP